MQRHRPQALINSTVAVASAFTTFHVNHPVTHKKLHRRRHLERLRRRQPDNIVHLVHVCSITGVAL